MIQSKTISNQKRLESLANTFAKRSRQVCKVFDIKIVDKKLKAVQREQLKMLFVEGKWLYNSLIARMKNDDFDIFKHNVLKDKSIVRFDKDKNEIEQKLEYIPAAVNAVIPFCRFMDAPLFSKVTLERTLPVPVT